MPQRAGALWGSMTGTTSCLTGSAVQHNLGASARGSNKWLPGAWGALTGLLALVLGSSLASLLSMSRSFPPERPTGKNHWDGVECSDLVQRGTKMQVELSSYSKATHTSISKCQLQPPLPSLPATVIGPTTPLHAGQGSAQGLSTFSWLSQNVPGTLTKGRGQAGQHPTSPSSEVWQTSADTHSTAAANFCSATLFHQQLQPLSLLEDYPPLTSLQLCDLPTPFHRLAQCQAPPPPISLPPSVRVLAFSSTQLMHQGHSCSAPEPRVFHPPDPLTKAPPGPQNLWQNSFEYVVPRDH